MDDYLVKKTQQLADASLSEDVADRDITTGLVGLSGLRGKGSFVVKAAGTLAGVEVAEIVFKRVDSSLEYVILIGDGQTVKPGDEAATIEGDIATILAGERVALNFLQHLSGIATQTALYVDKVTGYKADIYDTRKTTPGLRDLEKYAVRMGGGVNHRRDLSDGVLIKDNHLAAAASIGRSIEEVVEQAVAEAPAGLKVEVEVETVEQARRALGAGADILLLDNMNAVDMRTVVEMVQGKVLLEASGGVTLETVRAIAQTGVDRISVGALTHSVVALDISLEIEIQQ